MDFLIATPIRSYEELKSAARCLETYNADGRWLVVGEDSPAAQAFLKAWSVNRQMTSYFLPLNLARKISPVAFSGPGGALNAALLCSALTDLPILLFRNGASPISKELPKILGTDADAVSGCCTGYSRDPRAWVEHARKALEALDAGIISKDVCKKQVREAFCGNAPAEKSVCTDSLCLFPQSAEKVCFSPKTEQAIFLWVDVAERMGLNVAEGTRAWSAHAKKENDLGTLSTVLDEYGSLSAMADAVDYVFKKSGFRTYSDYLLDEACQVAEERQKNPMPDGLSEKIRALKDADLSMAVDGIRPFKADKKSLREEGRAFFSTLKDWPKILQTARDKDLVRFAD